MILDLLYRNQMTNFGMIQEMQTNASKGEIEFFSLIRDIDSELFFVIMGVVFFVFYSRQTCFYYILVLNIHLFINIFAKLAFHDGRPFMRTHSIYPFECDYNFGNPSGGVQCSVALILVLLLGLRKYYLGPNAPAQLYRQPTFKLSLIIYIGIIVPGFLYVLL
jgi:hypothetical protein